MRRYLPRHDPHGMKANMGSANHASACGVGYFPPRAVPATCGLGVRPRAASCVSMPVPCTAPRTVQAVQRLSSRKPSAKARPPRRNTSTRVSNNCFGVSMPERWRAPRQQVNPSGISYCPRAFQVVSGRVNARGGCRQRLSQTPPPTLVGNPQEGNGPPETASGRERACSEKLRVCGRHRSTRIVQPNRSTARPVSTTPADRANPFVVVSFRRLLDADHEAAVSPIPRKQDGRT